MGWQVCLSEQGFAGPASQQDGGAAGLDGHECIDRTLNQAGL